MLLRSALLVLLALAAASCAPRGDADEVSGPYLGGAGGFNARGGTSLNAR